jgi:hypothetical protein
LFTGINRFIFETSAKAIEEELAASGCDGVIAGHCGLPFTHHVGGHLWHNAGVIGMPANDGTRRVWFSVLTPFDRGILIEHHPLKYDSASAAAKMRQRGLPEGYAAALETGLWPSCEILPARELEARRRQLRPTAVLWPDRPTLYEGTSGPFCLGSPKANERSPLFRGVSEMGGGGPVWVTGGKTRNDYMFSELPQIADIVGTPIASAASGGTELSPAAAKRDPCGLGLPFASGRGNCREDNSTLAVKLTAAARTIRADSQLAPAITATALAAWRSVAKPATVGASSAQTGGMPDRPTAAVVEMSQSSWLVGGVLPGIDPSSTRDDRRGCI